MSVGRFRKTLLDRVRRIDLTISSAEQAALEAYWFLLTRWNRKINLTSLPLEGSPPPTLDKLIVEPLSVAHLIAEADIVWFDLGSGGGSPAVPLKILRPRARLTLVESRTKKAAFLREIVRSLELHAASVFHGRIEELPSAFTAGQADLVTVRAVKMSGPIAQVAHRILTNRGRLFLFGSNMREPLTGFELVRSYPLPTSTVPLQILRKLDVRPTTNN